MLGKILWSFGIIIVFGAIFMIVTVVRNKYMGPGVPSHFHECESHGSHDCSACEIEDCATKEE